KLYRRPFLVREEIIAQGIVHSDRQRPRLCGIDRRLDDFEHPRFRADRKPAGLLRAFTELPGFTSTPFRIEIARSYNGYQSGSLLEPGYDLIGKYVIAPEFIVSPYGRLATHAHFQKGFKCRVEPGDPADSSRRQGLVVQVCVTDEEVLFEVHW